MNEWMRQRELFDALSQRLGWPIRYNKMVGSHFIISMGDKYEGILITNVSVMYHQAYYAAYYATTGPGTLENKMIDWSVQAMGDIRFEMLLAIIRQEMEKL